MAKPRNTKVEYAKRKAREAANRASDDSDDASDEKINEAIIKAQLMLLEKRCKGLQTDADADIDFAYRNMALATAMPLDAPSPAAWSWYIFSRNNPTEFLKITQKREDDKTKRAGTITNQRMEDDKRTQFAIIDRIEKQLTLDVKSIIKDLMDKFPQDVLTECRKYDAAWKLFLEREQT